MKHIEAEVKADLLSDELETELINTIDTYKNEFIGKGYSKEEFAKWCCEIVNKAVL